jgi:prephenate dehydratase
MIFFQGALGSYSHQALACFMQEHSITNTIQGHLESSEVIDAVYSQDKAFGFLPVENSIVGNVAINTQFLDKEPCHWISEHYHRIDHCLMAPAGTALGDITQVHSHPIALAQCRDFLVKNNIQSVVCLDTAHSAKELAERPSKNTAVIASSLAAKLYGLQILSEHVQNAKDNFTRFIFFCHNRNKSLMNFPKNKMTLLFATAHRPGSLLRALEVFAHHQINLTKLESKLDPQNPFHYFFTVDLLGNVEEERFDLMIQDLQKHTSSLQVLGKYRQAILANN